MQVRLTGRLSAVLVVLVLLSAPSLEAAPLVGGDWITDAIESASRVLATFGFKIGESGSNLIGESGSNLVGESGSNLIGESGSNLDGESGSNLAGESGSNLGGGY